jgi:hypothetical protein
MRVFACAMIVVAVSLLVACHGSAPRDPNDQSLHPIARTGLALALDGDEVVLAIWVTRTGAARDR